jgi:uncharacterized protein YbjT (DUF2867 family)
MSAGAAPAPILIAGGTGRLGTLLTQRLTAAGRPVRVLTRDPGRAAALRGPLVEIAPGDVRDPAAVERAVAGAQTIISAVHGFDGSAGGAPKTVDWQGNQNLIRAAQAAGARRFILLSIHGAGPDHPMDLFRMKYRAEQALRASDLAWTIIRPSAYMETWGALLGAPLARTGVARVFGRGDNPINFVSVADVARFVELAVADPALEGGTLEVGGPENLSLRQVVEVIAAALGRPATIRAVPLPMMRLLAVLLRPVKPAIARQIAAGVVMDTRDMTFDPTELRRRYPAIPLTPWAEVARRDFRPTTTEDRASAGVGAPRSPK